MEFSMEDGEVVLEVAREEIKLDRPPVALKNENCDPNFALSLSYAIDGIKEKDKVPNGLDILSIRPNEFHPLSSSETISAGEIENVQSLNQEQEPLRKDDTNEPQKVGILPNSLIDETKHNDNQIGVRSMLPITENNKKNNQDNSNKKNTYKRNRYGGKQQLISCLKRKDLMKEKRGVKFHEGSDIISEHIEPVDPWRDVRTPSKAEVISFYRNSCQKLRSRPIDKVIKQIQEAPDLSCRADTLVLRGCRLDTRSCEALESIFRRVQFENLDLENCNLEEEGATSLLEMIEFYHSSCKLNIACNPKIGMRGWQALCRMLRKTSCLKYLDARRTLLTDMTMPTFGRCLKADPPLKILHLENVYLSGRPLLILTTAMKYNKILEELYIGDNELTTTDGPPIGAMLTYNCTLQLLDLRNNNLKDIGLAHIGNGLCDQSEQHSGGGLSSLILWNNGLTHEGMAYICEGLARTNSLKALNLGQNRLGDFGLQKLKAGLIKNKSIRKLGFLNTKLASEGAVALAEVLADSLCLTRIDIRENHIQVAGLMAFSMALKVNQSLLRLDLDKDIKKEPGMESVIQTVLVDIYNLCHRNKNILRNEMITNNTDSLSRQSSVTSDTQELISCDDVFHPEALQHHVVAFSPQVSFDNPATSINFPVNDKSSVISTTPSILPNPTNDSSPESKAQADFNRRANRFSVTKILDNLGHHAAGVANKIANNISDHKLKRHNSKEKIEVKSSELVAILDQQLTADVSYLPPVNESITETKATAGSPRSPTEPLTIIELTTITKSNSKDTSDSTVSVTASITTITNTNDTVDLNIVANKLSISSIETKGEHIDKTKEMEINIMEPNTNPPIESVNNTDTNIPTFNNADDNTPTFNNADDNTPTFNNADDNTPTLNNTDINIPTFYNTDENTPTFNNADDNTPYFNNADNNIQSLNENSDTETGVLSENSDKNIYNDTVNLPIGEKDTTNSQDFLVETTSHKSNCMPQSLTTSGNILIDSSEVPTNELNITYSDKGTESSPNEVSENSKIEIGQSSSTNEITRLSANEDSLITTNEITFDIPTTFDETTTTRPKSLKETTSSRPTSLKETTSSRQFMSEHMFSAVTDEEDIHYTPIALNSAGMTVDMTS